MTRLRENVVGAWTKRTLAAGALVAALLIGAMTAPLAHASSATFTVNTRGDEEDAFLGDGVCDVGLGPGGVCTLRAAIQQANASPGADVINFDIFGDSGVQTITPSSPLPLITEQVTIDGYTQPGASPNTKAVGDDAVLKIELDGTKIPFDNGLEISDSSGSVIRGLVINRFGEGIVVTGDSVGNRIEGNFIGTNPRGTLDKGNNLDGVGIFDGPSGSPSKTVVGGSTPDRRNVLSGNANNGLFISESNGTLIKGNYVGTDKGGTKDLGNFTGGIVIFSNSTDATVGGKTAASRNVISGNDTSGLAIGGSQGTKVLGNRVGTTASGAAALGNDFGGVSIYSGTSNTLVGDGTAAGSNTIAFNTRGDGVEVNGISTGNQISRNSIFSNEGLGIDLITEGETTHTDIPTPNDPGDGDSGANNLQNKPVLTSAKTVSGKTTIKGKLDSIPSTPTTTQTFTIEFYSNPPDTNEGKKFIGEKSVTTSVDGLRSFTFTPSTAVQVGQAITVTATNASTHDTSEFSAPRTVASS